MAKTGYQVKKKKSRFLKRRGAKLVNGEVNRATDGGCVR